MYAISYTFLFFYDILIVYGWIGYKMFSKRYIKKCLVDIKKHHNDFYKLIKNDYDVLSSEKTVNLIYEIYKNLTKQGPLFNKFRFAFIKSCLIGIRNKEIILFSMCSNSLTNNPLIYRDKVQYKKILELNKYFQKISSNIEIKIKYICILPDYEEKYNSEKFDVSWDNNVKQIQTISGVKTFRLSKIANATYNDYKMKIFSDENIKEKIKDKIDYYSKNKFIVLGFDAESDFQAIQITNYSIIGLMLEDLIKNAILIDVQKKIFPFEQPFYNFARKEKLPMIFYGQNLLNN